MKYLLIFHTDESARDEVAPEERRAAMEAWNRFDREASDAGVLIACEPLERSESGTILRVADGEVGMVTDGPFAETKEQVGGFCLLDCDGFDAAMQWARKVPLAEGAIEVRAVMDLSEYGYEQAGPRAEAAS
jgi:hypothetical protein